MSDEDDGIHSTKTYLMSSDQRTWEGTSSKDHVARETIGSDVVVHNVKVGDRPNGCETT